MNWCETDALNTCDQSIAKDLASQIVLSYVTLTDDAPVTVRVDAKFDNPNDDGENSCLADQGVINGSFTQKQFDFTTIAGDVRLGQISLRSEGLSGNRARAVVRAEYIPRNIETMEFRIACAQTFNEPVLASGILDGWTLTNEGNNLYRITRPDNGDPLPYGAFGDLLTLEFPDAIPDGGVMLEFAVTAPVYSINDTQGKYFVAPDTITVSSLGSFAPAFPTPGITVTNPPSDERDVVFDYTATTATIDLRNAGGNHIPTSVWLNWTISELPTGITVSSSSGSLVSTKEDDSITLTLDRSISPGIYLTTLNIVFNTNSLGTEAITAPITVFYVVTDPSLEVTSNSFSSGAYALDFGAPETQLLVTVRNKGQSTLDWRIDDDAFPDWLTVSPSAGSEIPGSSTTAVVYVNRTNLTSGTYTDAFTIQSDAGSQTVSVTMTVP
jgi:hypothetical protein